MPSLAPPSSSLFSSVVSQASGVQAVRARLLSNAPSLEVEDAEEDVETADLRSLSSSSSRAASSTTHSHATCESCAQLETDFAGAVLFVESYQGPHRILTQENSSPKKDFYAFYQQATVGPCPTTAPPAGLSKLELSKWCVLFVEPAVRAEKQVTDGVSVTCGGFLGRSGGTWAI